MYTKYDNSGRDVNINNMNSNINYNIINQQQNEIKMLKKANRNISKEIFDSCSVNNRTSLKNFIIKYIQLLQTSKICLIRELSKKQILNVRLH